MLSIDGKHKNMIYVKRLHPVLQRKAHYEYSTVYPKQRITGSGKKG